VPDYSITLILAQQILALTLFMSAILTDDSNNTISFYYFALSANCFNRSTNLHS